jgi:hypothetical protein
MDSATRNGDTGDAAATRDARRRTAAPRTRHGTVLAVRFMRLR